MSQSLSREMSTLEAQHVRWAQARARLFGGPPPRRPVVRIPQSRPQEIVEAVATRHGTTIAAIQGGRKPAPLVVARYEACWRLRHETDLSLQRIADFVGLNDHSCVIYALKKYARTMRPQGPRQQ